MSLNPKQVKLLFNFFPISSNLCVLGITEQALTWNCSIQYEVSTCILLLLWVFLAPQHRATR
jgi:hypothetical protein